MYIIYSFTTALLAFFSFTGFKQVHQHSNISRKHLLKRDYGGADTCFPNPNLLYYVVFYHTVVIPSFLPPCFIYFMTHSALGHLNKWIHLLLDQVTFSKRSIFLNGSSSRWCHTTGRQVENAGSRSEEPFYVEIHPFEFSAFAWDFTVKGSSTFSNPFL